jgi:hypothetical protein
VKPRVLWLLLLSACTGSDIPYDYALTWACVSPEGCEREDEVVLVDRLNVNGELFYFASTRTDFYEDAQRVDSDSLPVGCFWLYSFSLFGDAVEPPMVCRMSGGFDWEFAIPNRNPATNSLWRVEARELGLL